MTKNNFILFILYFLGLINISYAQTSTLSNEAKVSVLTCGLGTESYSRYGHTAIRIKDLNNAIDIVYNYGAFDFDTPNFILKFIKGDLQYFVSTSSFDNFYANYVYENRSVYEQELNLSYLQKQQLFTKLNQSLLSEDKYYTYKFIDRNCTTMVVDKINELLPKNNVLKKTNTNLTYRTVLYGYAKQNFFENLGINIIFGNKVDNASEKIFLPFDLYNELKNFIANDVSLVKNTSVLFKAKPVFKKIQWYDSIYILVFLLLLIIWLPYDNIKYFYFLLMGILGIFFSLVGFYSLHEEVLKNYNILLFNPAYILLVYFSLKKNFKFLKIIVVFLIITLSIYLILMLNKIHFAMVSPIIITNIILLLQLFYKQKKLIAL